MATWKCTRCRKSKPAGSMDWVGCKDVSKLLCVACVHEARRREPLRSGPMSAAQAKR